VLVPRGEFSIAIAGIGMVAGVEPDLGPLAAAYVLVLAVAAPLVARLVRHRLLARPPTSPARGRPVAPAVSQRRKLTGG
jgi:CPA2 family monovalent cation:H+ antiporter-2